MYITTCSWFKTKYQHEKGQRRTSKKKFTLCFFYLAHTHTHPEKYAGWLLTFICLLGVLMRVGGLEEEACLMVRSISPFSSITYT